MRAVDDRRQQGQDYHLRTVSALPLLSSRRPLHANMILRTRFRGLIKILERTCREKKWRCESFHGDMSFDARDDAINRFSSNPKCKILIASMKCGGKSFVL